MKKIILISGILILTILILTPLYQNYYIENNTTIDTSSYLSRNVAYKNVHKMKKFGWDINAIDKLLLSAENTGEIDPNYYLIGSDQYMELVNTSSIEAIDLVDLIITQSGYDYKNPSNRKSPSLEYYPELNEDSQFFQVFNKLVIEGYYIYGNLDTVVDENNYATNPYFLATVVAGKTILDQDLTFLDQAKNTSLTSANVHYYRNELNQLVVDNIINDYKKEGMTDLDAIMVYNDERVASGKPSWIDVPKTESMFHMFGEGGENNLKIQDSTQSFEIVFNMETGELNTNEFNLQTYNFGYSDGNLGHTFVDVNPYFLFSTNYNEPMPTSAQYINARTRSLQPASEIETQLREYFS